MTRVTEFCSALGQASESRARLTPLTSLCYTGRRQYVVFNSDIRRFPNQIMVGLLIGYQVRYSSCLPSVWTTRG